MALASGASLGPYHIVTLLGTGGMGEVYRAQDTRLRREVAVKTLKTDGVIDAAARARFQREARSVAALNHPHICAVYDVGVHDDTDYLVMELLDGETLASRLARGPLPVKDTLRYAGQIAAALGAAHRAGIVHRDLKPGNVMLTRAGAKLMDFGLAMRCGPEAPAAETLSTAMAMSVPGVIMGTWPYMAPEQILGRPADARTDVFAFGVVLYEMLAGRRPFLGDRATCIAEILERDPPPLARVAPHLPDALCRVVEKCLLKDPDHRWQTMHDLADDLRWIELDFDRPEAPVSRGRFRRGAGWIVVPLAALVGLLTGLWSSLATSPPPAPVVRFTVSPSDLEIIDASIPELSPDGRHLAFLARPRGGGLSGLYLHDLASGSSRRLEGTDGATYGFWAPDSRTLGFVAGGRLLRTVAAGGNPRAIMDVQGVFLGATWGRGDTIVLSQRFGLYRVLAGGGTPVQVTALDPSRQENSHRWPQFLPDGERFVFVARSGRPDLSSAYLGFVDGRPPVRLMETSAQVRFASSGHLLYVQDETLMARQLDASSLKLVGEALPVADGVLARSTGMRARISVSETGVLAHQGLAPALLQLRWYDRAGRLLDALEATDTITNFRISPDGGRVAMDLADNPKGGRSVWVVDTATQARTRVTFGESDDWIPVWSPDGARILFASYRDGPLDLYVRPTDGSTPAATVLASEIQKVPEDWSSDGRIVLVTESTAERSTSVVAYATETGARTEIAATKAAELGGRFSPDDRFVAYASDESGRFQIYVQPFPPTGAKWQISTEGGTDPHWRAEGGELYYLDSALRALVVSVETEPALRYSSPALLFQTRAIVGGGATAYDVTADGRRFLIREWAEPADSAMPMHVVLNWPTLLARR